MKVAISAQKKKNVIVWYVEQNSLCEAWDRIVNVDKSDDPVVRYCEFVIYSLNDHMAVIFCVTKDVD